jgi:hypothetical protein
MTYRCIKRIVICFFLFNPFSYIFAQDILLSSKEIQWVGEKVFENECSGKEECLLEWNDGEDFLSLGVGHFIWYPQGQTGPFEESFIKFLSYLKNSGEKLPGWLNVNPLPGCPWGTKDEFLRDREGSKVAELYQLLTNTKFKQMNFIVNRLDDALAEMLESIPEDQHQKITEGFLDLASTPEGIFALIDYINFKGLGIVSTERYHEKGWGLVQVLSEMNGQEKAKTLESFVKAANKVLEERVRNSPPERNEQRWLAGWKNRVASYLN